MPVIQSSGVSISYSDIGHGLPIFMSHGYSATEQMWRPQLAALTERYRLITWDMRGHGASDSPDDPSLYSQAHTVGDMLAILDHAGVDKAVIGGLSLGGYVTLAFQRAHPERCRALLLCDTGPGYRNPAAREEWNGTAEKRALAFEERGFGALGRSPEVAQTGGGHRSAQGLANAARGMLKQFDAHVIEGLPSIDVPVLIIVGENDKPYLAGSDYMAAKIPGAGKVVIPNAGHSSNIDQPEAFNGAVLDFLAEVDSPATGSAAT